MVFVRYGKLKFKCILHQFSALLLKSEKKLIIVDIGATKSKLDFENMQYQLRLVVCVCVCGYLKSFVNNLLK